MRRGEIWWADLPEPQGSEPGFTRPVVVMQNDRFNETDVRTTIVAIITSNLRLAKMPGNVLVEQSQSPLPRDSVVNVSQMTTVDKSSLVERIGRLPDSLMSSVDSGLRLALGL